VCVGIDASQKNKLRDVPHQQLLASLTQEVKLQTKDLNRKNKHGAAMVNGSIYALEHVFS
jgi:hypothetical protein